MKIMSRKVDIDTNNELWIPAFTAVHENREVLCPRCGGNKIEKYIGDSGGGIGFMLLTCENCGKTGYMSRMRLDNVKK